MSPIVLAGAIVIGCGLGMANLAGLRLGKVAERLVLAAAFAFVAVQGPRLWDLTGLALTGTALAAILIGVAAYRRRGPWRAPCAQCPDLEVTPCPGFRRQFRRELAFQRLAARRLNS
jgi:hypothetical protein